jgi:hypothetical protein
MTPFCSKFARLYRSAFLVGTLLVRLISVQAADDGVHTVWRK